MSYHYLNSIDDDEDDDREWIIDDDENFNYTFYRIFKEGCECYIGSTKDLKRRICTHKYSCNNQNSSRYNVKLYKYIRDNGGFNTFEFEVVDKKYCNKKEAEIYEGELMKKYKSTLNTHKNYSEDDKKNAYIERHKKYNNKKIKCEFCNCFIKRERNMKNHILTKKHIQNLEYRIKQLEEENINNITINIQNLNINLPQD
jgi:hypothetical protein